MALLACVARKGYHSVVTYQWYRNEALLRGETYSLLYTAHMGTYKCKVEGQQNTFVAHFQVSGNFMVSLGGGGGEQHHLNHFLIHSSMPAHYPLGRPLCKCSHHNLN